MLAVGLEVGSCCCTKLYSICSLSINIELPQMYTVVRLYNDDDLEGTIATSQRYYRAAPIYTPVPGYLLNGFLVF